MKMLQADMFKYDVYVTFLRPKPVLFGENGIHWAIMVAHPGLEYGTMYHVARGRKQGKLTKYERHVRSFRTLDSDEIIQKIHISTIESDEIDKFNTILAAVPLRDSQYWDIGTHDPEVDRYNSEQWTVEAVMGLEDWAMAPHGTSIFLEPESPCLEN